jgi:uncharacterized delta-60 repeat protein
MKQFILLLLCCICVLNISAQVGSLDPSFGNNGVQTTAIGNKQNLSYESGRVVLPTTDGHSFVVFLQGASTRIARYLPNGRLDSSYGQAGFSGVANMSATSAVLQGDKIVVTGNDYSSGLSDFVLVRYTANGVLDSSFGMSGRVSTDFNSSNDLAAAVIQQGDKIVVAGRASNANFAFDFALARYTADGVLDSSFGTNGKVTTDFSGLADGANSVLLREDKIVVAGYSSGAHTYDDFALARYQSNGMLDSSFGINGKVITDFNGNTDQANSMLLQGDKLLVAGSCNYYENFALARYTKDGMLDPSFGENGKVTTDFRGSYDAVANTMAVQGDKILVAGYTTWQNPNRDDDVFPVADFTLVRYNINGGLDSSFASDGKVITDFDRYSSERANSVVLQGNHIVIAGDAGGDFGLARYHGDGRLDSSFGTNGIVRGYFPVNLTYFTSMVLQGEKIVVAGASNTDFTLARYQSDGMLDSSFGINGKVITDFNGGNDQAKSMVLQGDKIVVAGNSPFGFGLARYTKDGLLDSSFGQNGKASMYIGTTNGPNSMVLQGDKIVVAGTAVEYDGYGNEFFRTIVIARFTGNGALDSSFGTNGIVIYSAAYADANAMVLQGDKIVVAGNAWNPNFQPFTLARYTSGGVLDSSFGTNGIATTGLSRPIDVRSVLLQGDKIVVAGGGFALARFTKDGVLDSSFGKNGIVITGFGGSSGYFESALLQEDKILVAGWVYNVPSFKQDLALARYTKDGVLDSSFSDDGIQITNLGSSASISDIALQGSRLYAVGSQSNIDGTTLGIVAAYQLEEPSALPSVSGFTLVNAANEQDIQLLKDGDVLNLSILPKATLNIRANTTPARVGSVFFELSGEQSRKWTENGPPYALFGDIGGNYFGGELQAGDYTLTATPYSKANRKGDKGTPLTIHFKVVYPAAVTSFTLVNTLTGKDIQELEEGDVINLSTLPSQKLNIRTNTLPDTVGSVVFVLSGQETHQQIENLLPYALFGDLTNHPDSVHINPTPTCPSCTAGNYSLTATPYSAKKGHGAKGLTYTINFTVIRQSGCVPHPAGLVNWWPGDGNANDITDGMNGMLTGDATFTAGRVDQAFGINGNGSISIPDNDVFTLGSNPFTIDLWVRFTEVRSRAPFIGHDEGGGELNKWIFWYDEVGHDKLNGVPALRLHINSPVIGPQDPVASPWNPTTGQWYHVAVTREGNQYALYIDGAQVATSTNSNSIPNPSAVLTIGQAEGYFHNGPIDEVEVFNRALTPAEIRSIYNAGSAGKCKPLPLVTKLGIRQKLLTAATPRGQAKLHATPNPFTQTIRIQYAIPTDARVNIKVYDALGREVGNVFNGQRSAGTYSTEYNTSKLSQGVYYCRMIVSADGKNVVQTLKLAKTR